MCRGVQAACYFVRICNSHSEILQYSSETLRKIGVNWSKPPKRAVRKALFSMRILSRRYKLPVHTEKVRGDAVTTINSNVKPEVQLGVMNARSVANKLDYVFDHIIDNNLDIVALTVPWLSNEEVNNRVK